MRTRIKTSIYAMSLLMMGVIGITGSLSAVGNHFSELPQYMIQNLIALPCFVIIPTTLVVGSIIDKVSKKHLALFGILCFIIGGTLPAFITCSFWITLIFRAVLGIGTGIIQIICPALNTHYFSDDEQKKVQGNIQACQMIGIAVMVFAGGSLAEIKWNYVFLIHLIALLSLYASLFHLPSEKPVPEIRTSDKYKPNLKWFNSRLLCWAILIFVAFIAIQVYSIYFSFLIDEKNIGGTSNSGLGIAFFALGGAVMGFLYNLLVKAVRYCDIAIGCFILACGYYLIAFSSSMCTCYIGSILLGTATSIILPGVLLRAGDCVSPYYTGLAISIITCFQNLGQCLCAYIISPIAGILTSHINVNFAAFTLGGIISVALFIIMFIWGIRKNKLQSN